MQTAEDYIEENFETQDVIDNLKKFMHAVEDCLSDDVEQTPASQIDLVHSMQEVLELVAANKLLHEW